MELKRFYADDMSHGIRDVKKEMGSEAVILGSTRIGERIEIVAAIDYDEELYEDLAGDLTRGKPLPDTPRIVPVNDDLVDVELRQELKDLHASLKSELAELSAFKKEQMSPSSPGWRQIVQDRLQSLGLSADVSKAIAGKFPKDTKTLPGWRDTFSLLGRMLTVGDDEILEQGGVIAVVGSTGVGKTTTVAKLAAQFAMRHGRDKVALITTDTFRVGGQEQLSTFGRLLGVPVSTAASSKELSLRIRETANYDLVLIDTAGISQRDIGLANHLQSISEGSTLIKPYLVLSSTCELRLTQEVIGAFYAIPLKGAIVTKIDEAASLGPLLSEVIRHKLPISYVCNGQDIPHDIATANKKALLQEARHLMELSNRSLSSGTRRGQLRANTI